MQGLQESIFLQALGFAVLNSLWQAALTWSILSLLSRLAVRRDGLPRAAGRVADLQRSLLLVHWRLRHYRR